MDKQDKKMISPVRDMYRAYTENVVVIEAAIGKGEEEDPVRVGKLYYTNEGIFIGEVS